MPTKAMENHKEDMEEGMKEEMKEVRCIYTQKENQEVTDWGGGATIQLSVYPQNCSGGHLLEYIFEITSSTVIYDTTDFTQFYGYKRLLMVIEGEMTLIHGDGKTVHLGKYEYDCFDGNDKTRSMGKATDYEIVIKNDDYAELKVFEMKKSCSMPIDNMTNPNYHDCCQGIYCHMGAVTVIVNNSTYEMGQGEQLSVFYGNMKKPDISVQANVNSVIINADICYNENQSEISDQ